MTHHRPCRCLTTTGLLTASLLLQVGCSREERPATFEPNLVQAMKYQIKEHIPMDQASEDATWIVTKMFGTPDEPKLPDVVMKDEQLASIVSLERLQRASGPEGAAGRGLFRANCRICHGVTGNGRGPTASVQIPYPRDYRMGIFKFKSTPRGTKPTRDDLTRVISQGIGGTAMKKIPTLSADDIQALVDYVIYLSWRGELERMLIDDAVIELDMESGDRIINGEFGDRLRAQPQLAEKLKKVNEETDADELIEYEQYLVFAKRLKNDPGLKERLEGKQENAEKQPEPQQQKLLEQFAQYNKFAAELKSDDALETRLKEALRQTSGEELKQYELFVEAWGIAEDYAVEIGESWLEAKDEVLEVPEPPAGLPVAGSHKEYVELSHGDQATQLAASVQRGKELFMGKIAACNKCHGDRGLGDGQTADFDDWTKDWTVRADLKPDDREALIPLLARGALPPIHAIPRNFQEGIFRGGSSSKDLYRRITQGVDGTPMPSVTFVPGQFERDDVWNLINFVRSLQTADADDAANPPEATSGEAPQTPAA